MKLLKFEEFCQNLGINTDNMFAKSSYESYLTSIKSKCKSNLRSIFIDFTLKNDDNECKIVEDLLINYIEDKYKDDTDKVIIALGKLINLYLGYDICNDVQHNPNIVSYETKGKIRRIARDHIGNEFNSTKEMCEHWGIPCSTFYQRIYRGQSLEEALTTPVNDLRKAAKDHIGNEFNSTKEMCEHWGINLQTYYGRLKRGWSLEETLTTPGRKRK